MEANVDDFLYDLDELLEDERFSFAGATLAGIKRTISTTRVVTDGQRRAVANIRRSRGELDEQAAPRWVRRYEGL